MRWQGIAMLASEFGNASVRSETRVCVPKRDAFPIVSRRMERRGVGP